MLFHCDEFYRMEKWVKVSTSYSQSHHIRFHWPYVSSKRTRNYYYVRTMQQRTMTCLNMVPSNIRTSAGHQMTPSGKKNVYKSYLLIRRSYRIAFSFFQWSDPLPWRSVHFDHEQHFWNPENILRHTGYRSEGYHSGTFNLKSHDAHVHTAFFTPNPQLTVNP